MNHPIDYRDVETAITRTDIQFDYDSDGQITDIIRTDYSGRGMFGNQCFGLVLESHADLLVLFLELSEIFDDYELIRELAADVRTDNMGMRTIYYFPGWQLENVPEGADA